MPNATWPVELPPLSQLSDYAEQPPDLLLKTAMDAGPPKRRRRFTAGIELAAGKMRLTVAQKEVLRTFFDTTLLGGSLPFDGTHPSTGEPITATLERPTFRAVSGGVIWEADISLEVLP